jgi:hypothetical protein
MTSPGRKFFQRNLLIQGGGKNRYTWIAPDFDSYSRRIKESISGYMTFDATKNTGQKTSKTGIFVFSASLTIHI